MGINLFLLLDPCESGTNGKEKNGFYQNAEKE